MADQDLQSQKRISTQQTLPVNRGSVAPNVGGQNESSVVQPSSSQSQQESLVQQVLAANAQIPLPPVQTTYNKWETHTHMYKIVLVGDAGVGKTHIINRYVKGQLPHAIIPTIGIEFATKTVTLRDGGSIKTQIWDTAGQEKYRSITSAHYRKAVGALLVYDVTKEKSFEAIQRWLKEIRLHADPQIVLLLVGNKLDLATQNPQQRRVGTEEAAAFAKENHLLFEESSALLDVNITDAFEKLLEEIYDQKCRIQSERSVAWTTEADETRNNKSHRKFDLVATHQTNNEQTSTNTPCTCI